MTHRRQNFMGGAAILAGAVAVTKLLGALYKIPLGNLLDREGMAHFYAAYNIYSLLLVLSTAGLPVALSRMVSRAAAQRRYGAVRRCLHLGLACWRRWGWCAPPLCVCCRRPWPPHSTIRTRPRPCGRWGRRCCWYACRRRCGAIPRGWAIWCLPPPDRWRSPPASCSSGWGHRADAGFSVKGHAAENQRPADHAARTVEPRLLPAGFSRRGEPCQSGGRTHQPPDRQPRDQ